ncbi:hypothetical protein GGX14DRAFT_610609 [Mycena pura]|uniref:Uncharacterized protein n=1 Tax=Mycena pura TaxID=153505 RepID=A0AAD6UPE4_9AGAR|nr:hypothetical protein GGX14DRAFT_610609 [Mycena pura]
MNLFLQSRSNPEPNLSEPEPGVQETPPNLNRTELAHHYRSREAHITLALGPDHHRRGQPTLFRAPTHLPYALLGCPAARFGVGRLPRSRVALVRGRIRLASSIPDPPWLHSSSALQALFKLGSGAALVALFGFGASRCSLRPRPAHPPPGVMRRIFHFTPLREDIFILFYVFGVFTHKELLYQTAPSPARLILILIIVPHPPSHVPFLCSTFIRPHPSTLHASCQSCGYKILKLQYSRNRREYYLKVHLKSALANLPLRLEQLSFSLLASLWAGSCPQDRHRWLLLPPAPLAAPALRAAPLIHTPPLPANRAPVTAAARRARTPTPAVKQEQPHDNGFIIDTASAFGLLVSGMVGVFRLNPRQQEKGRRGRGRVHVVLERLLSPEVTGDGEDDGGGRKVREAKWKCIPRWSGDAAGARRGWLLAFSPDFDLDAEAELEPSWELAYPRTRTSLWRTTRMRCTTLPHSLARACATSPIHTHAYVQSRTRTSAYDMSALRRWSLSAHAHAQGSSASLM